MNIAEPVRQRVEREVPHKTSEEQQHKACKLVSILHSINNLLTYLGAGLKLHG